MFVEHDQRYFIVFLTHTTKTQICLQPFNLFKTIFWLKSTITPIKNELKVDRSWYELHRYDCSNFFVGICKKHYFCFQATLILCKLFSKIAVNRVLGWEYGKTSSSQIHNSFIEVWKLALMPRIVFRGQFYYPIGWLFSSSQT